MPKGPIFGYASYRHGKLTKLYRISPHTFVDTHQVSRVKSALYKYSTGSFTKPITDHMIRQNSI